MTFTLLNLTIVAAGSRSGLGDRRDYRRLVTDLRKCIRPAQGKIMSRPLRSAVALNTSEGHTLRMFPRVRNDTLEGTRAPKPSHP